MSNTLKRKRTGTSDGAGGGSHGSVDATSSSSVDVDAGGIGASRRAAEVDTALLRTHLEQTLASLHASTARIEATLQHLPSRPALTELSAPAQRAPTPAASSPCPKCIAFSSELSSLRVQIAQHQRERDAWRVFKAWWLDSLAKRERRRSRRRDATTTAREDGGGEMERIVRKLDAGAKRVWADAGVLPPEGEVEGELGDEQSEMTLPVVLASHGGGGLKGKGREGSGDDGGGVDASLWLQRGRADVAGTTVHAAATTSDASAKPAINASASHSRSTTDHNHSPPIDPHPNPPATTTRPSSSNLTNTTTHRAAPNSTATATRPAPHTREAAYVDDTPIRNAHARRTMHASACPDCALFYAHLNSTTSANAPGEGDVSRQACSRHRTTFARATTPEGYWDIAFPSTQQAEAINRGAASRRRGG
ncbi:uncharacterized protein SRS1_13876 [Sporisorium reilianum f. sp. reilianum]|uniref:DNA endonuclease activator Ctp1 C-terminal domain-containing protein n=1 Tax=Sporisorium reilianum f. sp. reilianum TaxID=72559 RepID=A0A2N8UE25_9BASI|nr:uncharacterized protein SRS1_13876 [Sporisorium reilianum f. sp. reilianum]